MVKYLGNPEKYRGISLGKTVPIDIVSSVIAIVNSFLPEIEYVFISKYDSDSTEITIGMNSEEAALDYRPLD